MKILELFAGTRSIGKVFEARGHEVFSVEWDKDFENINLYEDISKLTAQDVLEKFGKPDVIWASPDCTSYSVAAISKHRRQLTKEDGTTTLTPISEYAKFCDITNSHVVDLILELKPKYYFIENPRGGMRKMDFMQPLERHTVTYCFAGDTRVITFEGTSKIKDLVGKNVKLLTSSGEWVEAPVRNYGKQEVVELNLSRGGRKKTIRVTKNHKWIVKGKEIETSNLKKGHRLDYIKSNPINCEINNEYVARGFVYGDGYNLKTKDKGFALFCGEKTEMLNYFDGIGGKRWHDDKGDLEVIKLYGFPKDWKTTPPSVYDSPSDIFSWLAGYIASDGSVSRTSGQITLASSKRSDLETVRTLCRVIGLDTYSINEYWRKGYGEEESPLFQITLMRKFVPRSLLVRSKHLEAFDLHGEVKHQPLKWSVVSVVETGDFEDVYCAEVPDTHTFALEDGILTHNCQYGDTRMKPTDIWTNHPDPQFKPACKNGAPCHVAAPRGSRTGTQGLKGSKLRSVIPQELCEHIADICER